MIWYFHLVEKPTIQEVLYDFIFRSEEEKKRKVFSLIWYASGPDVAKLEVVDLHYNGTGVMDDNIMNVSH